MCDDPNERSSKRQRVNSNAANVGTLPHHNLHQPGQHRPVLPPPWGQPHAASAPAFLEPRIALEPALPLRQHSPAQPPPGTQHHPVPAPPSLHSRLPFRPRLAPLRIPESHQAPNSSGSPLPASASSSVAALDNLLSLAGAARVCPQCNMAPLGPAPVGSGGRPVVSSVCEDCRQRNIFEQVYRANFAHTPLMPSNGGFAAVGNVNGQGNFSGQNLSQQHVHQQNTHRHNIDQGGIGQGGNDRPSYIPDARGGVCCNCRRPGKTPAPGRTRCLECIAIANDYGGNANNIPGNTAQALGRPKEPRSQPRSHPQRWAQQQQQQQQQRHQFQPQPQGQQQQQQGVCDVCRSRPVPAGQWRCAGCIALDTPVAPTTSFFGSQGICVVCERNLAAPGRTHCDRCAFEGTRTAAPLPSGQTMWCGGGGDPAGGAPINTISNPENGRPLPQQDLRDKMCGCLKNNVRDGSAFCEECYAAFRTVGAQNWGAWKRANWPGKRKRAAYNKGE